VMSKGTEAASQGSELGAARTYVKRRRHGRLMLCTEEKDGLTGGARMSVSGKRQGS
jgi:hypothetical protein